MTTTENDADYVDARKRAVKCTCNARSELMTWSM